MDIRLTIIHQVNGSVRLSLFNFTNMENSTTKKTKANLDRRQMLKTGLALAGRSLLAPVTGAQKLKQDNTGPFDSASYGTPCFEPFLSLV